jgi:hypothetical protein
MAREDDHPPAGCDRPIHMFEAVRLDPPARFEDALRLASALNSVA